MNEMTNSQLLLTHARQFFKGSLKTDNKVFSMSYGLASPQRKQKRLDDVGKANGVIARLRESNNTDEYLLLRVTPQEERAGNSNEYIVVALQLGIAMEIPYIWLVDHEFHMFLVLADESMHYHKSSLRAFDQYENNDFWVCDPWFNIHCKLAMYGSMASLQSSRWSIAGKEIRTGCSQEPANLWCLRLFEGEMTFLIMTDRDGMTTDDCNDFLTAWT
ncbi:hypothetical protein [Endozoicomonas euniceicola]|uniref:Uncharacterized protein n=1 Tax=Endozoicomonas euniceicola TaxID=1234143 RepID=A0ABY6GWV3_9GAMM|nr:hypothetical protein [Endozoicomonas euniceicola]UYM16459.1 hypothetical protein NX720_00550 [Endozoicomonas euniceicola]